VIRAVGEIKKTLSRHAARKLGCAPHNLVFRDGRIFHRKPALQIHWNIAEMTAFYP
jgi:hypothetical protein